MKRIDLRSDTVTKPTEGMLEAMMKAVVGDDVIDIDPTTRALEDQLAKEFGFDRGLFCPSGTMANQIALMLHTRPGDEIICDALSHIYWYEGGGPAANAGVSLRLLPGERGCLTADLVANAINPENEHAARTALISLENTANKAGGTCYDLDDIKAIRILANKQKLPVHLDGARLFNALIAKGQKPQQYKGLFDTMSICLSKGLGCPVGSVLLVNNAQYNEGRRIRKRLGGGMRQSGFLAAAGLYALNNNIERLQEDHQRAEALANILTECDWVKQVIKPQTNIVIFYPYGEPDNIIKLLNDAGIDIIAMGGGALRLVTHMHISDEDVDNCRRIFSKLAV
ncbi:MAG: aminotransferase class I/II-fold pyridoxal phosphate-dependent enzyme [Cryomorphaceae bacterium]|nr:aminotransferase class I/II-fold pyridoxal phosphate-dependent enzyme [Cryomorphaceae bacterium]